MLSGFRGFPFSFRAAVRSCLRAEWFLASMASGGLVFGDTPHAFERWEQVLAVDGERFRDVVHGNGWTLAAGDASWYVSGEELEWTRIESPVGQRNVRVEFVGGSFVAHGNGAIAFSTNGTDWVSSGPLSRVVAIARGDGTWVVVDADGRINVGTAAGNHGQVQWRSPAHEPGAVNPAAAFGGGRFLVFSGREAFVSDDGIHWRSSGQCRIAPVHLIFAGGRFFASGMDDEGYPHVISSVDGETWTEASLALGNRVPELLVSDFGVHVGAGDRLYSSADGRGWREDWFVAENNPAESYYGSVPRQWPAVTVHGVAADKERIVAVASGRTESHFPMRPNRSASPVEGIQVIDLRSGAVRQTVPDEPFLPSSICLTETEFVVATGEGALMGSGDAREWEFVFPPKVQWNAIAGNAYRVVAVGNGGWVARSEDGRAWEAEQAAVEADLNAVATDGERFVAVGDWGTILVSEDGVSWTLIESPAREHLQTILFHRDRFVVMGGPTILYSLDGWNWSRTGVMRQGYYPKAMSKFGGKLVTIDSFREDTQLLLVSENGISWEREEYQSGEALSWVAGTPSGWIGLGRQNPERNVLFRTDGERRFARSEERLPGIVRSIEAGETLIAAGQGVHALDGGSWKEVASHNARDVAFFRDRLWTVGINGIFQSHPLRATKEFSPDLRAERAWRSVDGRALEGELVSADFSSATIRRSADGRDVEVPLSRLAFEDRIQLEEELDVVFSEDRGGSGNLAGRLTMPLTWRRPELPAAHRLRFGWEPLLDTYEHDFTGLTGDGAVVVAVGKGGLFLVSGDHGSRWREVRESPPAEWLGVKRIGDRFVAWASHVVAVSNDGLDWTFSPIDGRVVSVAGSEDLLCAVGARGFVAVSRDGIGWATVESVTISDLKRVVSIKNRYVAISHNALFHSRDGRSWTEVSFGEGTYPQELFAVGNRFFMTKRRGSQLSVAVSKDGANWEDVRLPDKGAVDRVQVVNGFFAVQQASDNLSLTADGSRWEEFSVKRPGFAFGGARIQAMQTIGEDYLIATDRGRLAIGAGHGEWDEILPTPPAVLEAFYHTGERYLAAGRYGTLLTSESGREWKPVRGLPVALYGAATLGRRLVVAGAGGIVAFSDQAIPGGNALAFITNNTTTENDLFALGNTPDGLLAVGSNGYIAQSQDGQKWSPIASELGIDLTGLAFSDDAALVTGMNHTALLQRRGSRWTVANELGANTLNLQATFVAEFPSPQWSVPYFFDGSFFRLAQISGRGSSIVAPPVLTWRGSRLDLGTGNVASQVAETEMSASGKLIRTFPAGGRIFGIGSFSMYSLLESQQLFALQGDGIWRETPVMLPPGTLDVTVAENRLFAVGMGGRVHRSRFLMDADVSSNNRTWSDREGREIVASLIETRGGTIRLRRLDGQEFVLSLDRLSPKDRQYVQLRKVSLFTAP